MKADLDGDYSTSPEIKSLAQWLSTRLLMVNNTIIETYSIVRMLNKVGNKTPSRPSVALQPGQVMTRIVGYYGYGHIFNIADMLTRIGFTVISSGKNREELDTIKVDPKKFDQCMKYSVIREAINSFCN